MVARMIDQHRAWPAACEQHGVIKAYIMVLTHHGDDSIYELVGHRAYSSLAAAINDAWAAIDDIDTITEAGDITFAGSSKRSIADPP